MLVEETTGYDQSLSKVVCFLVLYVWEWDGGCGVGEDWYMRFYVFSMFRYKTHFVALII